MATILVTSLADDLNVDGQVTLREAIAAANTNTSVDGSTPGSSSENDRINFQAGLTGTIRLNGTELAISEGVELMGPGADQVTIDAAGNSRVFSTSSGGTFDVHLQSLSITGGLTIDPGGGIAFLSSGTLSLTRLNVFGNSSEGSAARGGGVFAVGDVVTLESTISGNSALGEDSDGGGIFATGNVEVNASTISDNTTSGYGGAIFSSENLTLSDSTISGNTAESGGGIFNDDTATITNSTIYDNLADTGGGIFNDDTATITNSTIYGNIAESRGGGIFNVGATATLTVSNSTVYGNTAEFGGGGIYNEGTAALTNSTVFGNTADFNGGGIYNDGAATVTNSTIAGNTAEFEGGGVYNGYVATVTNSTVFGNTADFRGGGIYNGDTATVTNSTIAGNTSDFSGGGIYDDGTATVTNTIVAGNNKGAGGENDIDGSLEATSSNNLIGDSDSAGGLADGSNGNIVGVDWRTVLENDGTNPILKHNGGPTETIALIVNPDDAARDAVDAGSNTLAKAPDGNGLTNDQRGSGFSRVFDGDGDTTPTVDIGAFEITFDFGDAPTAEQSGFASDYPVTLARNGARHLVGGLFLGHLIDAEADGQPDARAGQDGSGGDDNFGSSDEDGVYAVASMVATAVSDTKSSFALVASSAAVSDGTGKLDAWIDFNQDGDWDEANEQIFNSIDVAAGLNILSFTVPAGAAPGETAARFRISSRGGLAATGAASDGEVEDYIAKILDGDASGGADVEVEPTISGTLDVVAVGNAIVIRSETIELFHAPGAKLKRLDIFAADGDDTLNLANLDAIFGGVVGGNTGAGNDTLRLTGSEQDFDLTQIADTDIKEIETIDITGSGDNTLTLTVDEVVHMSPTTDTLRVRHDDGDVLNYGDGWKVALPQIVDGQYIHVLAQASATLQVVNTIPFRNPLRSLDVNRDGSVSPVDALSIINRLNATGPEALQTPDSAAGLIDFFYFDTNGDRSIAPIDVLLVVNFLDDPRNNTEGEASVAHVDLGFVETTARVSAATTEDSDDSAASSCDARDLSIGRHLETTSLPPKSDRANRRTGVATSEDLFSAIAAFFSDLH